jgi:hypothetical protein
MCKRYICNGFGRSSRSGVTNRCRETCTACMSIPPCRVSDVRIPCELCNRTFRSQTCFDKHRTNKLKGKTVCEQKRNCAKCDSQIAPMRKHECFKPFCANCNQNKESGNFCYMRPLVNRLPKKLQRSVRVLWFWNDTRQKAFWFYKCAHSEFSMFTAILRNVRDGARYTLGLCTVWQETSFVFRWPSGWSLIVSL